MKLLSTLPVSLRQLQYIVAVAELANFRRAAEACHVAQPSLSAQVGVAEQALGVQLFERTRRRGRLVISRRCRGTRPIHFAAPYGSGSSRPSARICCRTWRRRWRASTRT